LGATVAGELSADEEKKIMEKIRRDKRILFFIFLPPSY
jgi:hypothetical protein